MSKYLSYYAQVNCIPEGRVWALLHLAVYWNNTEITRKLLDIDTCDALVKLLSCLSILLCKVIVINIIGCFSMRQVANLSRMPIHDKFPT